MIERKLQLIIECDHPSFEGHFPGSPILPGAVLLLRLQNLVEQHYKGWAVKEISSVKFLKPVTPGAILDVTCTVDVTNADGKRKLKLKTLCGSSDVCHASLLLSEASSN